MEARSSMEARRMRELALRAQYAAVPQYSRFLEPSILPQACAAASEAQVQVRFFGGYAGAERCIGAFWAQDAPQDADFPLVCLKLRWNARYASPGHRDLLGAVLGLGLERDAVGDIVPGAEAGTAYLFVHRDVEAYVCANLDSAGRATIQVSRCMDAPQLRPPEGICMRVTVSSPRLDAVLAAGYKLSRSEAQKLIEGALVKRNHVEILRGDVHLEAGDLLSVRGHGRMRVESIDGATRKGRLALRLFKYTG